MKPSVRTPGSPLPAPRPEPTPGAPPEAAPVPAPALAPPAAAGRRALAAEPPTRVARAERAGGGGAAGREPPAPASAEEVNERINRILQIVKGPSLKAPPASGGAVAGVSGSGAGGGSASGTGTGRHRASRRGGARWAAGGGDSSAGGGAAPGAGSTTSAPAPVAAVTVAGGGREGGSAAGAAGGGACAGGASRRGRRGAAGQLKEGGALGAAEERVLAGGRAVAGSFAKEGKGALMRRGPRGPDGKGLRREADEEQDVPDDVDADAGELCEGASAGAGAVKLEGDAEAEPRLENTRLNPAAPIFVPGELAAYGTGAWPFQPDAAGACWPVPSTGSQSEPGGGPPFPEVVPGAREGEYVGLQSIAEMGEWAVLREKKPKCAPFFWNIITGEKSWEAPLIIQSLGVADLLKKWSEELPEHGIEPGPEVWPEPLRSRPRGGKGGAGGPGSPPAVRAARAAAPPGFDRPPPSGGPLGRGGGAGVAARQEATPGAGSAGRQSARGAPRAPPVGVVAAEAAPPVAGARERRLSWRPQREGRWAEHEAEASGGGHWPPFDPADRPASGGGASGAARRAKSAAGGAKQWQPKGTSAPAGAAPLAASEAGGVDVSC